jgi:hypothetical protein
LLIREEERKHLLCLLIVVRLREFAGEERGAVGGGGERKCLPLLLEPLAAGGMNIWLDFVLLPELDVP